MQSKQLTEYKRHWKGVVLDYDFLLIQDNSLEYMVCFTELELQILLALLLPAQWKTRYYSDTQEINQDVIDTWIDGIYLELMGYCMPCGDFGISIDVSYAQYINTLVQNYDGTPSSVNENAPDDFFSDGEARERALCMALEAWAKSYVSAWLRAASVLLTLGILALFFFAVPVVGWVAVILIGGLAFVTQSYYDALSNEASLENVVCCWYEELKGVAISKSAWGVALATCVFEDGSDERLIQSVIASELGYDKQWVSFLDVLGDSWPLAQAGVVDCSCGDCEMDWSHDWLGGDNNAGDWSVQTWGEYNAGLDRFDGTNRVVPGTWDFWDNVWLASFDITTITKVVIDVAYNNTFSSDPTIELASIEVNGTVVARLPGATPSSGTAQLIAEGLCLATTSVRVRSTAYHPNGVMTGYTRITKIHVEGVGVDPFI